MRRGRELGRKRERRRGGGGGGRRRGRRGRRVKRRDKQDKRYYGTVPDRKAESRETKRNRTFRGRIYTFLRISVANGPLLFWDITATYEDRQRSESYENRCTLFLDWLQKDSDVNVLFHLQHVFTKHPTPEVFVWVAGHRRKE